MLNSSLADSGWKTIKNGLYYRIKNGFATVVFEGCSINAPGTSGERVPNEIIPSKNINFMALNISPGSGESAKYYSCSIYSSSSDYPGLIVTLYSGVNKIYGSVTYPI